MLSLLRGALAVFAVAAGLSFAAPALASADDNTGHADDIPGHVYVNGNTAGTNTISGYDRHADGSLTPMPGSPFVAGGAGTEGARVPGRDPGLERRPLRARRRRRQRPDLGPPHPP